MEHKEIAKEKIIELIQMWKETKGKKFTEEDTATKMIRPFIMALGWDIYNFNEVKEQLHIPLPGDFGLEYKNFKADCVLYINNNPYAVIDFKTRRLRSIENNSKLDHMWLYILHVAVQIGAKYAIVTSFTETMIQVINYDTTKDQLPEPIYFKITEYEIKFELLWGLLSKEMAMKGGS